MKTIEDIVVIKALDIIEWCYGRGENLQDSDFVKHTLMGIAQQQKDIDEDAMHAIVEEQVNKAIEEQKEMDTKRVCEYCCSLCTDYTREECPSMEHCATIKDLKKAMEE